MRSAVIASGLRVTERLKILKLDSSLQTRIILAN